MNLVIITIILKFNKYLHPVQLYFLCAHNCDENCLNCLNFNFLILSYWRKLRRLWESHVRVSECQAQFWARGETSSSGVSPPLVVTAHFHRQVVALFESNIQVSAAAFAKLFVRHEFVWEHSGRQQRVQAGIGRGLTVDVSVHTCHDGSQESISSF